VLSQAWATIYLTDLYLAIRLRYGRISYLEAQALGGFLQALVAHFQTNLVLRELSGAVIAAITAAINNLCRFGAKV
jgi:hypothetical protein